MIEGLVKENKVMLFMKGNKMFPQCGFSNSAVQVNRKTALVCCGSSIYLSVLSAWLFL